MKKTRLYYIILAALFTALIAVFAQIQIPTPFFPITLQTFAIAVCGYTLEIKYSVFSVLAYMLLGIVGAPVFSGFCGGFHHISGPAGGFVIGFPLLVLFCSLSHKFESKIKKILFGILGTVIMYIFGIIYFMFVTDTKSILVAVLMFIGVFIKDICLCISAFYISQIIVKRIIKNGT